MISILLVFLIGFLCSLLLFHHESWGWRSLRWIALFSVGMIALYSSGWFFSPVHIKMILAIWLSYAAGTILGDLTQEYLVYRVFYRTFIKDNVHRILKDILFHAEDVLEEPLKKSELEMKIIQAMTVINDMIIIAMKKEDTEMEQKLLEIRDLLEKYGRLLDYIFHDSKAIREWKEIGLEISQISKTILRKAEQKIIKEHGYIFTTSAIRSIKSSPPQ